MEGFLFYWIVWCYWILANFFIKKERFRLTVSLWLLLSIILSLNRIRIHNFEISASCLFLLITAYFALAKEDAKTRIYLMITSFVLMLAYSSFLLFELFDPVWVIFDRTWLLALIMTYVIAVLQENYRKRIITLMIGMINGEILYSVILGKLSLTYPAGSFAFLDVMALTVAFILLLEGLQRVALFFEGHLHDLEKEKQKLS